MTAQETRREGFIVFARVLAAASLAVFAGTTLLPSFLSDQMLERVRSTAWFVLILSTFSQFIWGNAADEAWEIAERFRPRWWPEISREKARSFLRRLAIGGLIFGGSLYFTDSSRPWIAAVGVLALCGSTWWAAIGVLLPIGTGGIGRAILGGLMIAMLIVTTGMGAVLVAALIWKVDLVDLMSR